jgi:hypothetical protein
MKNVKFLLANKVYLTYHIYMRTVFVPDLRDVGSDDEVTIEHISVLQERLGQVLDDAHPGEGIADIVTNHFDPAAMKEEILAIFTPKAFLTMFQTEIGKGVLIGAFYQSYIDGVDHEESD